MSCYNIAVCVTQWNSELFFASVRGMLTYLLAYYLLTYLLIRFLNYLLLSSTVALKIELG